MSIFGRVYPDLCPTGFINTYVSQPCAKVSTSDDTKGLYYVFPDVNQIEM